MTVRLPNTTFQDSPSGRATWGRAVTDALRGLVSTKQDANANLASIAGLSLTGNANKVISVVAGEDGFELVAQAGGGSGIADGDYGDIVVSGSGTAINFDSGVVTAFAKTILDDTDAATVRATIGAQASGSYAVTTNNLSDLSSASTARSNLGLVIGTDVLGMGGGTLTGDLSVPDEAYGSGWNGSVEVPTKNAVYDKIESLSSTLTDFQAADLVITSNNVFQDTDISIALTAGTYSVELFFHTDCHATPDMQVQLEYTGTETSVSIQRTAVRGTTSGFEDYVALPAVYNMDVTTHYAVYEVGTIVVSDSGNLKLQARQVTSSGTSVTFKKGGWMRVTRLA